jgi:hypothetical protein
MKQLFLSHHSTRIMLSLVALLTFMLFSSTAAFADGGGGITSTLTAGSLAETNATPTIGSTTLSGLDQQVALSLPLTISDATGSGAGWNVTITSTTFTVGSHTLPTTAASVSAISDACSSHSTCTLATNVIPYPLTIPAATSAPAPVKLFNAAINTGMGQIDLTPTISVTIPANSYNGAYGSTISLAVVSAP